MAEAVPPELLKEDQAALIQNMRVAADGSLEAVRVPRAIATGSQLPAHTYSWEPVYLPTDCIESVVYVCFSNAGNLYLTYKKTAGYYSTANILTGIDTDNLQVSFDSQQFLFIDGRDGMGAQRIVIDSLGAITCRRFGTQQPTTAPVIRQIDNSKYEDQKFTGMPVGSILFYAYCIVNEYGE
ncbi:MAG TPA: hypothetical protein PKI15_10910, partial [Candidatus Cloacimonadota bacterium]|nr:hypothetical protein [Candidatus Cloacimonadota bacterium]